MDAEPAERDIPSIRAMAPHVRPKPGRVYVAREGDTLPAIAVEAYGTVDRWPDIWLENILRLADDPPTLEGIELQIPR